MTFFKLLNMILPYMCNIPKLHPQYLVKGDCIGIAAPASPFEKEPFVKGLEVLKKMGLKIYLPDDLFVQDGYLAGSDYHRARSLHRLFADPKINAIICARGGFGTLRILPLLDFALIRKNPKILVGFSDITALLEALGTHCNLVTLHGPTVTSLAQTDSATINTLHQALFSNGPHYLPAQTVIKPGACTGMLAGGNLTTLCHLVGTPFEADFFGKILFLEERGEKTYRIDRMLIQMQMAGAFRGLRGIILGDFQDCGSLNNINNIMKNMFKTSNIPIMAGLDAGHGTTNLTIPLGTTATLDTGQGGLSF